MLDDFSATKLSHPQPSAAAAAAPPSSAPVNPSTQPDATTDDDFARQLQAGMAGLLGQLDNNADMQKEFEEMMKELAQAGVDPAAAPPAKSTPPSGKRPAGPEIGESTEQDDDAAFDHQEIENMMKQLLGASGMPSAPASGASTTAPSGSKKAAETSFQDTIRKTMERMQNSGETASAAAASSSEDDMLAQMLKQMEGGDFGGGSEEDLNKMLMGMMEQLTNKDILYDPMKELHDKFPAWLTENKAKTPKEDLVRYEEQQKVVGEIVARFERKQYSDDSNEDREYIVERMQQVCINNVLTLIRLTVPSDASSRVSTS